VNWEKIKDQEVMKKEGGEFYRRREFLHSWTEEHSKKRGFDVTGGQETGQRKRHNGVTRGRGETRLGRGTIFGKGRE